MRRTPNAAIARALATAAVISLAVAGCGGGDGSDGTSPKLTAGEQASLSSHVAKLADDLGSVATDAGKCVKAGEVAKKGMKAVNECASKAITGLSGELSAFGDDVGKLVDRTTGPCRDSLEKIRTDLSGAEEQTAEIGDDVSKGELAPFALTAQKLAPVLAKLQGNLASALSACRP